MLSDSIVGERGTMPLNAPKRKRERRSYKSHGVILNHTYLV